MTIDLEGTGYLDADGKLLTRASGNPSGITRAALAADAAFTGVYRTLASDRIWIRPGDFSLASGSAVLQGTTGDGAMQGWVFDAAAVEGITVTFAFPAGWSSINLDMWWLNEGAGAGDVRWRLVLREWVDGTSTATLLSDQSRTETALAQDVMNRREDYMAAIAVDPERIYRLQVLRSGTDGADTLGNDATFLGCTIRRVG